MAANVTPEEAAALDAVLLNDDWQSHELLAAVEAIVAAHVTAALNEAANAIEAWRDMSHRFADDETRSDEARSKAIQRANAYVRSAAIVRARTT